MATHTDKDSKRRKRRVRSPHPGVVILERKRATGTVYLARWSDPDTGRRVELSLSTPDLGITNEGGRKDWAVKKSASLRTRRQAITSGTAVITCTSPADAVRDYYETREAELKASTVTVYREGTDPFLAWSRMIGLACLEDLTGPKLVAFRDWFTSRNAKVAAKGEKGRGTRKAGARRRSAQQINKCLRALRTFLSHQRKRGLTPALTSDTIKDGLANARVPKKLIQFLRQSEIVRLLEAVQRHDAELNDGLGHARERIGPFVLTVLLTGMRVAEAEGLRWKDVDLEAGEIILTHDRTKTGHARRITLAETPVLATLLSAMKLRADKREYVFGEAKERKKPDAESKAGKERPEPGTVPLPHYVVESARKRLIRKYGAPDFSWHTLRRTCGTFLTCAPAIYGAASAFLSAKRLGHSVNVAEKAYYGAVTNISPDAKTLEAAMGVKDLGNLIARQSGNTAAA